MGFLKHVSPHVIEVFRKIKYWYTTTLGRRDQFFLLLCSTHRIYVKIFINIFAVIYKLWAKNRGSLTLRSSAEVSFDRFGPYPKPTCRNFQCFCWIGSPKSNRAFFVVGRMFTSDITQKDRWTDGHPLTNSKLSTDRYFLWGLWSFLWGIANVFIKWMTPRPSLMAVK